jgi:hypothetical protein
LQIKDKVTKTSIQSSDTLPSTLLQNKKEDGLMMLGCSYSTISPGSLLSCNHAQRPDHARVPCGTSGELTLEATLDDIKGGVEARGPNTDQCADQNRPVRRQGITMVVISVI